MRHTEAGCSMVVLDTTFSEGVSLRRGAVSCHAPVRSIGGIRNRHRGNRNARWQDRKPKQFDLVGFSSAMFVAVFVSHSSFRRRKTDENSLGADRQKFRRQQKIQTTALRRRGLQKASCLPAVTPTCKCRLRLSKMDRIKDFLLLEREFIEQQQILQPHDASRERARERIFKLRGDGRLQVAFLEELLDDEQHAIVSGGEGGEGAQEYVSVLSIVDKGLLIPGAPVLLHSRTRAVVGVLEGANPIVEAMLVDVAPRERYSDIGGLEEQIQELREAVELPLTHPELFAEIGIDPPKGCILYGPPGTGKTLMAKAVAHHTSATFLRVVGSELIRKYHGEGPRLVKELFRAAHEMAPAIIFIDEVDAVGSKRYHCQSGAEREIQRTLIQLLVELDGFDCHSDVKVIMATNRIDILDPALIRAGRIDRKILIPRPDLKTKRRIFNIHSRRMSLHPDVRVSALLTSLGSVSMSGADIRAMCLEAGLIAMRERRMLVQRSDFQEALERVMRRKQQDLPDGLYL